MREREEGFGQIQGLIKHLESGERPVDQYIARSMRELYMSGSYRTAILKGADDHSRGKEKVELIRIVGMREGRLDSFCLSENQINRDEERQKLDILLEETRSLPIDTKSMAAFGELSDTALNSLRRTQLQSVAGMTLSKSLATGNQIVQVIYPRTFRELLSPFITEPFKDDLALGVAAYFLKTVPFGKGNIQFTIPSH